MCNKELFNSVVIFKKLFRQLFNQCKHNFSVACITLEIYFQYFKNGFLKGTSKKNNVNYPLKTRRDKLDIMKANGKKTDGTYRSIF